MNLVNSHSLQVAIVLIQNRLHSKSVSPNAGVNSHNPVLSPSVIVVTPDKLKPKNVSQSVADKNLILLLVVTAMILNRHLYTSASQSAEARILNRAHKSQLVIVVIRNKLNYQSVETDVEVSLVHKNLHVIIMTKTKRVFLSAKPNVKVNLVHKSHLVIVETKTKLLFLNVGLNVKVTVSRSPSHQNVIV